MMKIFKTYRYEIVAALSGAVVMTVELIGSRVMAPFFGTSLYVWTAIIGVILGALAFGYWYGGRLADRVANDKGLMAILTGAAILTALMLLVQEPFLRTVANVNLDVRIAAIFSSLTLFAPAALLLGIISPYLAKLRVSSMKTAGSSIGRLSAAGTLGSIAGTFLTGYWLIAWFGNFMLGIIAVLCLIATSFLADKRSYLVWRLAIAAVVTATLVLAAPRHDGLVADVDSAYARYQVRDIVGINGRTNRLLLTDNRGAQSGVVIGQPDELAFQYTTRFKQVADAYGPAMRVLVIGGGTYTFPSLLARQRPGAQVDAVEIDPALDSLATRYFEYRPQPNLAVIHDDGRVFLNRDHEPYDLIYVDAFSSLTPPYQLATVEAAARTEHALKANGAMVANVIAAPNGRDPYYRATVATYRAAFAAVAVYKVDPGISDAGRQNLVVIAGSPAAVASVRPSGTPRLQLPRLDSSDVLTDDHAPVEQLIERS